MSRFTTHELKTWPEPFAALLDGTKRHEVRKNDRGFAVGDVLHLREWDPSYYDCDEDGPRLGRYTGRTADFRVTHLTPGGAWGLPADLCVMSVEPVRAPTPAAPLDLDAAMWIVPGHAGDREWQVTGPDAEQRAKAVAAVTGTKPYPLYRIDAPALIARVREAEAALYREYHDLDAPARLARFARKVDRETRAMQREYPQFPCEFDRGHRNAIATLRRLLGLPPIKD